MEAIDVALRIAPSLVAGLVAILTYKFVSWAFTGSQQT